MRAKEKKKGKSEKKRINEIRQRKIKERKIRMAAGGIMICIQF